VRLVPSDEIEWDHICALTHGGPHTFDNLRPLHKACHRIKTSGNAATSAGSDIHMNAKVNNPKRTAKFVVTKPAIGEERPARTKQKMQSRGFDKTWKRPMNPKKRPERRQIP